MSIEAVLGLSRFAGFCKSPRLLIGVMQQGFAGLSFDPTEPRGTDHMGELFCEPKTVFDTLLTGMTTANNANNGTA
jgi:hypothetical protein